MLIERVNIPTGHIKADGLDAIQMDRLKQVVIVAGKNGSGKTRLLNKVIASFQAVPFKTIVGGFPVLKGKYEERKQKLLQDLSQLNTPQHADASPEKPEKQAQRLQEIKKIEEEIISTDAVFKQKTDEIQRQALGVSGAIAGWKIVHYVPKQLAMPDPKSMNDSQKEVNAKEAHKLGVGSIQGTALCKIQDLHTQYRDATHGAPAGTTPEHTKIISEYQKLNEIIKELLGVEIINGARGRATLFGRPIGDEAQLSDGQKVLLQLAVAIHCQGGDLANVILVMDEPENHLHPKAVIEVLEKLIEKIPDGQIWIATHSVSLIAHFSDQASLWFMDNGKVSAAGKIQEKVLESLLGDSSRIAKQKEFLERPDALALIRFAQECLIPPAVLMTKKGDDQAAQIRDSIQKLRVGTTPLKVLDYGAGKGRLLANMVDDAGSAAEIAKQIDYVAFDSSEQDKACCLNNISRVYADSDARWCSTYHGLREKHGKESFDLIVLCNVLHEINPQKWKTLFGPTGELTELLKPNGQLLLVEVQQMRTGEHAHEFGFLVLDTVALQDLFCVSGSELISFDDKRGDGRLKAHVVSKDLLGRVTPASIKKSIEAHHRHAKRQIDTIRSKNEKKEGLLFAFWMVQYANATMALPEM